MPYHHTRPPAALYKEKQTKTGEKKTQDRTACPGCTSEMINTSWCERREWRELNGLSMISAIH